MDRLHRKEMERDITMAMKLENINNLISDDLAKRNENWTEIDNTFGLKADKTYVDNQLVETEQVIMSFKEEYANYIDSELNFVLRELPNGTKDEIRVSGGKAEKIQMVKKYVLQASDVVGGLVSTNAMYYTNIFTDAKTWNETVATNSIEIENRTQTTYALRDLPENIGKYYSSANGRIYFIFANGTTLSQAKTALANQALTYQLAQPIITELALYDLSPNTQQIVKLSSKVEKLTNAIIALGGAIV